MTSRFVSFTRSCVVLGALALTLSTFASKANAVNITVTNNCSYQIAVGMWPASYNNGGWFQNAGTSVTFPSYAAGTGGRIWSRHNCVAGTGAFDVCSSGTCGGSGIQCAGTTAAGVTEAEINFNASGTDWYNVSYVDGYNDMASLTPSNGATAPTAYSKPACPTVVNDGYNGAYSSSGNSCVSPCNMATSGLAPYNANTALYCCTGAYGTSATCNEGVNWNSAGQNYVNVLHAATFDSYAYQYDNAIADKQTPTGSNYTIVFCPAGTTGSTGGGIAAGTHTLTPACATGSRLDDSNGGTTNGNKIQIWTATPGIANQNWNFASVGTNTWTIASSLGAYCLDDNSVTTSGVATHLWACESGNANQKWTSAAVSGGYTFKTQNGFCLDVAGALSANGTAVESYTCNSTNAQTWAVN